MSKNKLLIAISASLFAVTATSRAFAQTSNGAGNDSAATDTATAAPAPASGTMKKHKMRKSQHIGGGDIQEDACCHDRQQRGGRGRPEPLSGIPCKRRTPAPDRTTRALSRPALAGVHDLTRLAMTLPSTLASSNMKRETAMSPKDLLIASVVIVAWGVNFVVKLGLHGILPMLLGALRFSLSALPAVFMKRPQIPFRWLFAYGITISFGQFTLLFYGMSVGMPAGLASLVLQAQAFFTLFSWRCSWASASARRTYSVS